MTKLEPRCIELNGRTYVGVTSGIYRIVNMITSRTYIGSSYNMKSRLKTHLDKLANGKHGNRRLQRSWIKHGSSAFTLEHLIYCQNEELARREQAFIDAYIEHDLPLYNLRPSAESRLGFRYVFTAEDRAKVGAAVRGRKLTPEQCAAIHARQSTLEWKAMMSARMKGRILTPEHRKNLSVALMGHPMPQKNLDALLIANKGRPLSAEHRAKLSAIGKGKPKSIETRSKLSEALRGVRNFLGKRHSAETRAKMSASAVIRGGRPHTPESCAKMKGRIPWNKGLRTC